MFPEPAQDLFGTFVGRKQWIENLLDSAAPNNHGVAVKDRRINSGIGVPFRWSAAPSSTGHGRFQGRGKSGFSIRTARYLTMPRVTIRNLRRLLRLCNGCGHAAPRPPSSEPAGPRSLSLEFQKSRKRHAESLSIGAELPRQSDSLRFFLSQRIFLARIS